jgi:hypothetical protein
MNGRRPIGVRPFRSGAFELTAGVKRRMPMLLGSRNHQRIGRLAALISAPFAQQPGTPQPPGTPPQPQRDPTVPPPYEEPPRPIPIPRPDEPPDVIDDPPPAPAACFAAASIILFGGCGCRECVRRPVVCRGQIRDDGRCLRCTRRRAGTAEGGRGCTGRSERSLAFRQAVSHQPAHEHWMAQDLRVPQRRDHRVSIDLSDGPQERRMCR